MLHKVSAGTPIYAQNRLYCALCFASTAKNQVPLGCTKLSAHLIWYAFPLKLLCVAARSTNFSDEGIKSLSCKYLYLVRKCAAASLALYQLPFRLNWQFEASKALNKYAISALVAAGSAPSAGAKKQDSEKKRAIREGLFRVIAVFPFDFYYNASASDLGAERTKSFNIETVSCEGSR